MSKAEYYATHIPQVILKTPLDVLFHKETHGQPDPVIFSLPGTTKATLTLENAFYKLGKHAPILSPWIDCLKLDKALENHTLNINDARERLEKLPRQIATASSEETLPPKLIGSMEYEMYLLLLRLRVSALDQTSEATPITLKQPPLGAFGAWLYLRTFNLLASSPATIRLIPDTDSQNVQIVLTQSELQQSPTLQKLYASYLSYFLLNANSSSIHVHTAHDQPSSHTAALALYLDQVPANHHVAETLLSVLRKDPGHSKLKKATVACLFDTQTFPNATESRPMVEEAIEIIWHHWSQHTRRLLRGIINSAHPSDFTESEEVLRVQDIQSETRAVLTSLSTLAQRTFHNLTIARARAALYLVLEEPELCKRSVQVYLDLFESFRKRCPNDRMIPKYILFAVDVIGEGIQCLLNHHPKEGKAMIAWTARALELAPSSPLAQMWHAVVHAHVGVAKSNAWRDDARKAHQKTAIDTMLQITSGAAFHSLNDTVQAAIYYALAFTQAEARNPAAAIASAKSCVALRPSHCPAWTLLILILTALKQWDQAKDAADLAIDQLLHAQSLDGSGGLTQASDSTVLSNPQLDEAPTHTELDNDEKTQQLATEAFKASPNDGSSAADVKAELPASIFGRSADSLPRYWSLELLELLQLRNAIIEHMFGPEKALADQLTIFAFYGHFLDQRKSATVLSSTDAGSQKESQSKHHHEGAAVRTAEAPTLTERDHMQMINPDRQPGARRSISHRLHDTTEKLIDLRRGHLHSTGEGKKPSNRFRDFVYVSSIQNRMPKGRPQAESMNHMYKRSQFTALHPTHDASCPVKANLWLMTAASLRRCGRLEQAFDALQEAQALFVSPDLFVQYGVYYFETGQTKEAAQAYMNALLMQPRHATARLNLAILNMRRGIDTAQGHLNELTQCDAWDQPQAWLLLARATTSSDKSEVKQMLECALRLEQTNPIRPYGSISRCIDPSS